MAFAIPLIGAFASGATVAGIMAGTATFATYAAVAGTVLGGIGALTGNKDMKRLGAVVGLAGGISGLLNSGASAASGVADAAGGFEGIGSIGAEQMGAQAIEKAAEAAAPSLAAQGAADAMSPFAAVDGGVGGSGTLYEAAARSQGVAPDLAQQFKATPNVATPPVDTSALGGQAPDPLGGLSPKMADYVKPQSALEQAAGGMTSDQVQSWYDKAMNAMKGVGKFAQLNPELLKIGGNMLTSMYGPQAERMDLEKSLMERARTNLNTPIRLKYTPGG